MPLYRCLSRTCRTSGHADTVQEMPKGSPCSACGTTDSLAPVTRIHLLVPDPAGPIPGTDNRRWNYACDRAKQSPTPPRFYTTVRSACSCPECLAAVPEPVPEES